MLSLQSALQEKFSYVMAVQGLLDGGSAMVCRIMTFAVANEMGRSGVSEVSAATFVNSSAAALPDMPL